MSRIFKQSLTGSKPQLDWQFTPFFEWMLTAPIVTRQGAGDYEIHLTPRPGYCDRGDWLIHVDAHGAHDLDHADGFPRYFFGSEDEVKVQMERWLWRRESYRACHSALGVVK